MSGQSFTASFFCFLPTFDVFLPKCYPVVYLGEDVAMHCSNPMSTCCCFADEEDGPAFPWQLPPCHAGLIHARN